MPDSKSPKELAFIHDLFIATDWGERFAALVDEHIKLPDEGRVLYAGSGSGGHALALLKSGAGNLEFFCVDENAESIELARAKAATLKAAVAFRTSKLDALEFKDDEFALVIGDLSLVAPERLPAIITGLVRVAKPKGTVAVLLATSSSFGEFFSVYWEALHNLESADHEVVELISALPTVSEVEAIAAREDLEDIQTWTQIEEFDFKTGEEFLNSPLVADFLMKGWLRSISGERRLQVEHEIARLINEERHSGEFSLTVKATLLVGRKAQVPVLA